MRRRVGGTVRRGYGYVEDRPLAVVFVAGMVTTGVVLALGWRAGWPSVTRVAFARHSWAWLGACLFGELAAYGGYVLTVRDVARVDDGAELDVATSARAVVAGFGVFAATRSSGGSPSTIGRSARPAPVNATRCGGCSGWGSWNTRCCR